MMSLRAVARPRASIAVALQSISSRMTHPRASVAHGWAAESLLYANGSSVRSFSAATSSSRRRRPRHSSRYAPEDLSLKAADAELNPEESREKLSKESRKLLIESGSIEPFAPKSADGEDMPMDEYLEMTSLSPWVPVPDMVARRALDVAEAGKDDVHYELGSGDGRVCFHAIDTYAVKKTVGIDIDPNIVEMANDRLARRHPKPDNVRFICADLLDEEQSGELWDALAKECTVLTMFFVEEALQKIKPKLEEKLGGSECRIVTVGYKMRGWEPRWDETNLGLPIYMYVLQDQNEEVQLDLAQIDAMTAENDEATRKIQEIYKEHDQVPASMLTQESLPEPEPADSDFDPKESEDFHWDWDQTQEYDENGSPVVEEEDSSDVKRKEQAPS